MAQVYLGLGSNIKPRDYIRAGLEHLEKIFGQVEISPVFESEAVGFEGDNFLNLVVSIGTSLPVGELSKILRKIEDDNDRLRKCERFSKRTLDIDILTYDNYVGCYDGVELPRDEILKNAFVLWPLAELTPHGRHPQTGETYADLWAKFNKDSQSLWQVEW